MSVFYLFILSLYLVYSMCLLSDYVLISIFHIGVYYLSVLSVCALSVCALSICCSICLLSICQSSIIWLHSCLKNVLLSICLSSTVSHNIKYVLFNNLYSVSYLAIFIFPFVLNLSPIYSSNFIFLSIFYFRPFVCLLSPSVSLSSITSSSIGAYF